MQKLTALILSTLFLASCGPDIEVGKAPPPPERLTCLPLPSTPEIEPLQAHVLDDGTQVYIKADVDARDAKLAPYIIQVRGAWFSCSSQLAWNRDYWKEE